MDAKNDVSARFIEAYEALLYKKKVSDKRDFATQLGISPSLVTEITKGRSSVGTSAIQNIVSKFNISADWLLTGRGEMLADEQPTSAPPKSIQVDDRLSNLGVTPDLITELLNRITEQAAEIGRLNELVRQLQQGKGHNASDAGSSGIANAG